MNVSRFNLQLAPCGQPVDATTAANATDESLIQFIVGCFGTLVPNVFWILTLRRLFYRKV